MKPDLLLKQLLNYLEDSNNHRVYLVRLFLLLSLPFLLVYSLVELINRNPIEAAITFANFLIFLVLAFPLRHYVQSKWYLRGAGLSLCLNFIITIFARPNLHANILWIFLLPLVIAIIFDRFEAILWTFAVGILATLSLFVNPYPTGAGEDFYFIIFSVNYIIFSVLALIMNYSFEQILDRTQKIQAELQLEKDFTDTILNSVVDTIVVYNLRDHRVVRWNNSLNTVSGYTNEEIANTRTLKKFFDDGEYQEMRQLFPKIMAGESITAEFNLINKQGKSVPTEYTVSAIYSFDGKPEYIIAVGRDIHERKEIENVLLKTNEDLQKKLLEINILKNKLEIQAAQDMLTGLCNRRSFDVALTRELARAKRKDWAVCLLMIDIDNFKMVNDTYGHQCGDVILKGMGKLIADNVRKSDVACRWGGDEFILMLPEANTQNAFKRAEELRNVFMQHEFDLGDKKINLTLSIGLASYPEHANIEDELIRVVDEAMYQAKKIRNHTHIFKSNEGGP